ncbi:MAG TPA: amino acid adenylation domain-containing protein [Pyrinomonadaceae bacterium]|nr:amino acid adenylation domain-containing protein [Pyrinomonadaceae bacterium]
MSDVSERLAALSPKERAALAMRLRRMAQAGEAAAEAGIARRGEAGPAPLSFAQQRLWFLSQVGADRATYNLPIAYELRGALDVETLERSLDEVVRRHEALRTTFTIRDGGPVQVVRPTLTLGVPVVELPAADDRDSLLAELRRLADEFSQQSFDLERGPLVRAQLLKVSEEEHYLVVVLHHIVGDAWSLGILMSELSALYHAFNAGRPSPLAELPIQYADFAVWQREWLRGEVVQRQLRYWKEKLGDLPPALRLPTDHPRPSALTHRGGALCLPLSGRLTEGLTRLCRREGVTLFMALLAAFDVLLYRYTGQTDLSVGTPISGRSRPEAEGLIGLFVNTIVLRADLSGDPTFRELLGRVREMMLEAHAHQDVPFEKLVGELHPERSASHSPLFQVMLVLQNAPMDDHAPSSELAFSFSELDIDIGTSHFDLVVSIEESEGSLLAYWNYMTDLFEPATIERMFAHFQNLLEGVVADPGRRISALDILGDDERRLLVGANETRATYGEGACLHELFEAQAARTPDALALSGGGDHITYAELNARANRLARRLRALGVGPEEMVGLYFERSAEMVVALLAVLKAGGAYVPLDPAYPADRLAFMLEDSGARLLLTGPGLAGLPPAGRTRVIRLDDERPAIEGHTSGNLPPIATADNPAYVIYTSGSTGRPKGVVVTHANVARLFKATEHWCQFGDRDVWTLFHSFAFDFSVWEMWGALIYGGRLVVVPHAVSRSPEAFHALLSRERVTVLNQTPSAFRQLLRAVDGASEGRELSLRLVIFGGEALDLPSLRPWFERYGEDSAQLVNMYGITETTVHVTHRAVNMADLDAPHGSPIGGPLPDLQVYLLDRHLRPVPLGVPGEIYVGGAGLARGYLGRPSLTAERFIPHPFSHRAGERLYKSGDLARLRPNGEMEYLGRNDQQVKVRGFRIEPGEIEAALATHPEIREAAVVALQEGTGDKRLVAYTSPAGETAPEADALRRYLKGRLPEYMVPSAFVALDRLPLTPSGKVDRQRLPAPGGARPQLEQTYVAPRTALEQMLCEMWRDLLRVEEVGVHDNFFDLGGDSIHAAIFTNTLQKSLGSLVSVVALFDAPDIASLCAYLGEHYPDAVARVGAGQEAPRELSPIRAASRGGARAFPLSFAQQRLWFIDRLALDSPFYNIPEALRLSGRLDVDALERSFDEVVRRHEALRTSFTTDGGRPVQIVNEPAPLGLEVTDLSGLPEAMREREAVRLAVEEAHRTFDLTRAPLMRARLLRLGAREHVLLITTHHIVSDGWSVGVFLSDLSALYAAHLRGEPSPLEELPVQYADFAVWQREWLQGEVLEGQLRYWRRQLGGELPILNLPTDRPRPAVLSYAGADRHFELPEELTERLKALSRREGVTLYMTLLAAFNALLQRYTGQEDIVIGAPIAGRTRREVEGLVGFFVNTLALRTDLSGRPSFRELLGRVRAATLGAYAHQELPFERLVEELQPGRDLSRNPLFQVMFSLQNAPLEEFTLPGLRVSPVEIGNDVTRFDLEFHLWEGGGAITGSLIYSTELFDAATVEQMLVHFRNLLEGVVADPDTRLPDLPLLTDVERRQVLAEWNDTRGGYPRGACVHELFEAQAARTPDALAVVSGDTRVTYAELNARANRLARRLRALGVGPEGRVGVLMERSPEIVVAFLAVLKAGGAYVPLDPAYPKPRLRFMLEDADVRVLLTERKQRGVLPDSGARVVCLDGDREELDRESAESLPRAATADSLAYVIYTSGSTGRPKGVAVEHRAVNRLVCGTNYVELSAADCVAQASTATFDAATFEIWGALLHGARLDIVPRDTALSPSALAAHIRERGVTVLFLTTALFNQLAAARPEAFGPLRCLLFGGEAADPKWVREALTRGKPRRLLHVYGPTENTTFSTWHPVGAVPEDAPTVPIGCPVTNTQAYVLDGDLRPVPVGVAGELCLGGDGLMRGYLNRPGLTAEKLVPHPFAAEPGARLYRTGDLVRFLRGGALEFVGRVDHQVKVRGHRIEPGEIEAVIGEHPSVRECVVLAREDRPGERRLVAYVVGAAETANANAEVTTGGGLHAGQVEHWQKIFDDHIYSQSSTQADPSFNITGWNSNYTDEPLPAEEMRVWLEDTLAPIQAAAPRRVLEIGCGTGLLLARLAPGCERYWGTDVSKVALEYVRANVLARGRIAADVALLRRAADDFEGIEPRSFDAVILNSVVQYFPDIGYLLRVLEGAARAVRPGGFIFVGDVRSLPLLEAFHASVQLFKAPPSLPLAQLREQVRTRAAQENELAVAPAFFFMLRRRLPHLGRVEVRPKRGRYHNELTRFRYQVLIHVGHVGDGPEPGGESPSWLDWDAEGLTLDALRRLLVAERPASLALARVPNARLAAEVKTLELLSDDESTHTAGELRALAGRAASGVDPEDLYALGGELAYDVDISWARHGADGRFDVLLRPAPAEYESRRAAFDLPAPEARDHDWQDYGNNPLRRARARQLIPQLRSFLQERLPDYMTPSAFVMLDALPLNANGKVNRRQLPAPDAPRPELEEGFVAPRTPVEAQVAAVWAEVLGVRRVGVHENFFDLGGHSLVATQVVSRLCDAFDIELPLRCLFESPTVAGLSVAVVERRAAHSDAELLAEALGELEQLSEEDVSAILARGGEVG